MTGDIYTKLKQWDQESALINAQISDLCKIYKVKFDEINEDPSATIENRLKVSDDFDQKYDKLTKERAAHNEKLPLR